MGLMPVTDRWSDLLDNNPGSVVGVLSLDYSKVFDSIKYSSIPSALKSTGVSHDTMKMFGSYLSKR